jgi:adenylate cyclase
VKAATAVTHEWHVRVESSDVDLTARDGETLMAAAERLGYAWPTLCGGIADCTTCNVKVVNGAENLEPVGPVEAAALLRLPVLASRAGIIRLACQAKVHGPVVVKKSGVKSQGDPQEGQ